MTTPKIKVRRITYDFTAREGWFFSDTPPPMRGCVALFQQIDPLVRRIHCGDGSSFVLEGNTWSVAEAAMEAQQT